jgi:protein SCO1/2
MARLFVVLFCLLLTRCAASAPQAQQYELRGQILAIEPADGEVLIKHEDIKNFMPAMTMPYKVREKALLDGKSPGDLVKATLNVGRNDAWLSSLDKTGTAPLLEAASIPPAAFVTPLSPGATVPDTELVDQQGRKFSLREWRGHAFAITFIYLRCPLPQFCPLLDRRFAEVQKTISSSPGLDSRARLLSVSFDPAADTPAQLRAHAARLGADPRIWQFATAAREVIDRFAAEFGVNVVRETDRTITHNMRALVVDPAGRVVSVHEGSEWTARQIAEDLERALAR